jgi:hypothetical protein
MLLFILRITWNPWNCITWENCSFWMFQQAVFVVITVLKPARSNTLRQSCLFTTYSVFPPSYRRPRTSQSSHVMSVLTCVTSRAKRYWRQQLACDVTNIASLFLIWQPGAACCSEWFLCSPACLLFGKLSFSVVYVLFAIFYKICYILKDEFGRSAACIASVALQRNSHNVLDDQSVTHFMFSCSLSRKTFDQI